MFVQWSLTGYVVCALEAPGKVFTSAGNLGFTVEHSSVLLLSYAAAPYLNTSNAFGDLDRLPYPVEK